MNPFIESLDRAAWLAVQRKVHHKIALFFVAICALLTGVNAQPNPANTTMGANPRPGAVVQNEQVRAELVAHAPDGVEPGKTVWVGLQIQHQPQWHTYWKNPGDSGLPTTLQWTLPKGVRTGDIDWPTPERIAVGSLGNYGYAGTVLLPVPLVIGKDFAGGAALEVRLAASWLVCRQECIPQDGNFVLQVPLRGSTALHGADFETAHKSAAKPLLGPSQARVEPDGLHLTVSGLPTAWMGQSLQVFPESPNIADPSTSPRTQGWEGTTWNALLPLSMQRDTAPSTLPVVLALGTQSLRTVAAVSGAWPALPDLNAPAPAAPNSVQGNTSPVSGALSSVDRSMSTWGLAMAAALLGGLILNLMPCVLPVLAIKVLGFARHGSRASHRTQGLAYTAGVVLSFMALGSLMLALRATGEQLGWGFQLQSPMVVAILAALFTLIGLNLVGLFEVGSLLPQRFAAVQARHPVVDAFLSGVLAVAIASPCTAPFMGASLGYAVTLAGVQAMGIFAALGLGLALPFLAAAWVPSLGRWLPRPGAWMDTLRRFMAFPMFATVVWLVWVLGHLSGVDGAASLLALLVGMAMVVWSVGLPGRSRRVLASISIAACALLVGATGKNILSIPEANASGAASVWQAWTPQRVETELASGHPVFVDFTAAWCITCQYNKKTTLGHEDVLADFRAHQVSLLRADWTHRDPDITQALEKLGRNGVPVYVLYQKAQPPVLFSEILGRQDLRDAIARL